MMEDPVKNHPHLVSMLGLSWVMAMNLKKNISSSMIIYTCCIWLMSSAHFSLHWSFIAGSDTAGGVGPENQYFPCRAAAQLPPNCALTPGR